jgi:hypothetical protein
MSLEQAAKYKGPLAYVRKHVKPQRDENRRDHRRINWWLHGETVPALRESMTHLERYIVTPRVAKHRLFVFEATETLPDNRLIAIMRDDYYFFGVLHSSTHEIWSLSTGSTLEDRPFYTPTSTFETYPFPWPPGQEPRLPDLTGLGATSASPDLSGLSDEQQHVAAIARWARELVRWRDAWLNPPPPEKGTIDVAYDRLLKSRTLTNLDTGLVYYRDHSGLAFDRAEFDKQTRKSVSRAEIIELDDIHRALDSAVFRAYGWPETLTDEQILERLLALNLERAQEKAD